MSEEDKDKKSNILYTGYGDNGTTTLYDCKQHRISKSSILVEALGAVDELNAYMGIIKVLSKDENFYIEIGTEKKYFDKIIEDIQQNLFVIQAELGGSKMTVSKGELDTVERIVAKISDELPPIKSFTISGGSLLSSSLDFSRTLARRAERRIVAVVDEGARGVGEGTISYMNRLSTILFALSRYTNHLLSIKEEHPDYNR
jgi:cob(I)alamin adenosyltransferase